MMLKFDLGAGPKSPEGFVPVGNAHGYKQIHPLPTEDASIDVIRASHVLEHFPSAQIQEIISGWVKALKPGGELRLAVPDFDKVVRNYAANVEQPTEGYIMGGQVDEADFHKSIFTDAKLRKMMAGAGLVLIRSWTSELPDDCAALPISLNLCGRKPFVDELKVRGVMSVPRLGFNDMWSCAIQTLPKFGVQFSSVNGAFWEQCIHRGIERAIQEHELDYILALDYDSVFNDWHLAQLLQLAMVNPEADAIAALQSSRHSERPLFGLSEETRTLSTDGRSAIVSREEFQADLVPVRQAHFGFTLLKVSALKNFPPPWFQGQPDQDGSWGAGRLDPDVFFWRKWEESKRSLFVAPRVVIGHLELVVRWPGVNMQPVFQKVQDWESTRRAPQGSWTGGLDESDS